MNKEQQRFLNQLLETPSPSGSEMNAQKLWADEISKYTEHVECDSYGNTWASFLAAEESSPTLMIEAHADEIGFMIRYITDEGYIRVECIGGIDAAIARGRRVKFLGRKGDVTGVIGSTAIHLRDADEKAPKIWDLFIDVGASSPEEVRQLGLEVGDRGVYSDGPFTMSGNKLVSRALDNRINGYVLTEIARILAGQKRKPAWNIVLANTVQEEVGCIGAGLLAYRINPAAAICLDVTHATDSPGLDKAKFGDIRLGDGPAVLHGASNHPYLLKRLEDCAAKAQLRIQHEVAGRRTGTNTDSIYTTREGIPSALVSIPLRYMHTPVETIHLADVESTVQMLIALIDSLGADDHFGYRI